MDAFTLSLLTSLGINYFTQFSAPVIQDFFTKVFHLRPSLEQKLQNARTTQDFDSFFKEVVGVIDLNAGTGAIEIDGGLLTAVRGIRFNHADGTVNISGTTISANRLVTGGGQGATGTTIIGENTELNANGSSIHLGQGCSIHLSGNSSINQS